MKRPAAVATTGGGLAVLLPMLLASLGLDIDPKIVYPAIAAIMGGLGVFVQRTGGKGQPILDSGVKRPPGAIPAPVPFPGVIPVLELPDIQAPLKDLKWSHSPAETLFHEQNLTFPVTVDERRYTDVALVIEGPEGIKVSKVTRRQEDASRNHLEHTVWWSKEGPYGPRKVTLRAFDLVQQKHVRGEGHEVVLVPTDSVQSSGKAARPSLPDETAIYP